MTVAAPLPPGRELLTEQEVAALLKVNRRTVRRMVSGERLPKPIRLGPDDRYSPKRWVKAEVDAYIDRLVDDRDGKPREA